MMKGIIAPASRKYRRRSRRTSGLASVTAVTRYDEKQRMLGEPPRGEGGHAQLHQSLCAQPEWVLDVYCPRHTRRTQWPYPGSTWTDRPAGNDFHGYRSRHLAGALLPKPNQSLVVNPRARFLLVIVDGWRASTHPRASLGSRRFKGAAGGCLRRACA